MVFVFQRTRSRSRMSCLQRVNQQTSVTGVIV